MANRSKSFLLSTNVDVCISPTDHTATHRPNQEDDASRVPIFGFEPLGSNTDYMSTQIVQETHFHTPEKPAAKTASRDKDGIFTISEIPGSFLFRYMRAKVETSIGDTKTDGPKIGTITEGIKTDDIESIPENDYFLSALFDSSDESPGTGIPIGKKCDTPKKWTNPQMSH